MRRLPDFVIIGAMKCATSTLDTQLALQPGIFTCTPKEPYFFSNDEVYVKGLEWYEGLFDGAEPDDLCGEATTHYTKLPTYPLSLERMREHIPKAKLIYIMRHPIDRLVSQYVHEWSMNFVKVPLDAAVEQHPILVDYSRYSMQLKPFLETYGPENVLPLSFHRLMAASQEELERVCAFLGYEGTPQWHSDTEAQNISAERIRRSPLRDAVVSAPGVRAIRKHLVPQSARDWVKGFWKMSSRPALSDVRRAELARVFDEDLALLGAWLGMELTCENFKDATTPAPLEWIEGIENIL